MCGFSERKKHGRVTDTTWRNAQNQLPAKQGFIAICKSGARNRVCWPTHLSQRPVILSYLSELTVGVGLTS